MKKKSDIHYLSFEGGGGKGNAYLGAIYALQKLGILNYQNSKLKGNVKGLSGASAGALTAFFIGSGYDYFELNKLLSKDFNYFFDKPVLGEKVIAGKGFSHFNPSLGQNDLKAAPKWLKTLLYGLGISGLITTQLRKYLKSENPALYTKLETKQKKYIDCLIADWGLFSGRTISEEFFEFWLQYKIYCVDHKIGSTASIINKDAHAFAVDKLKSNELSDFPCTFKEHYQTFGVELAFTSVNFKTENVQVFSHKTTPDFPISLAVRMSMSLPLIYKPVIIDQSSITKFKLRSTYKGYWVDGGLFDNAPARVFNDVKHTVLLRLGNRFANNSISNLVEYIFTYLKIGIMGTGSGQVNFTTVPDLNVVELDVTGLTLLKFNIPPKDLLALTKKNNKIVLTYFKPWK